MEVGTQDRDFILTPTSMSNEMRSRGDANFSRCSYTVVIMHVANYRSSNEVYTRTWRYSEGRISCMAIGTVHVFLLTYRLLVITNKRRHEVFFLSTFN